MNNQKQDFFGKKNKKGDIKVYKADRGYGFSRVRVLGFDEKKDFDIRVLCERIDMNDNKIEDRQISRIASDRLIDCPINAFRRGYKEGYDEGYDDGFDEGFLDGRNP